MALQARGSMSSVKKAASAAEAPIWKAYLAIRSTGGDAANARIAVDQLSKSTVHARSRKRAKPSASRHGSAAGIWMTLATPTRCGGYEGNEDGGAVLNSIRQYWELLSVNERQQVLFLDEPELVKQLYKLNLSLLCVGLMQRHLKTSGRSTTDTASTSKKGDAVTATAITTSSSAPVAQERAAAPSSTRATTDTSSEKTYELLEAMEFMDIGTGILTVKTELAEDTDRLFTLVGDVLAGFLTSIHVLTQSNFNKLFVTESETINTWANYQRLIAMLVEQLILRGYVNHLEREATQQMEQLLLEVSLEDKTSGQGSSGNKATTHKKKSKKKHKKKMTANAASSVPLDDSTKDHETVPEAMTISPDDNHQENSDSTVEELNPEPNPEPTPEFLSTTTKCASESTERVDEAMSVDVEKPSKKPSGLNPNAVVFQPQEPASTVEDFGFRSPVAGKRKFDEYVVSVPWEDVASDAGTAFGSPSIDGDLSDGEDEADDKGANHRWRKQRRREEDAELEWQLQQVYASTSSLFGWDFSRQCELPDAGANLPWSESTLWRTAPKEVVRYFSPGDGDAYSRFHAPHFLPYPAGPPSSRYYFNPPFGPPMLPPPGLEPIPPALHGSFGFQSPAEFPMVVQSPDFSNTQYHPSNDEDEMEVDI